VGVGVFFKNRGGGGILRRSESAGCHRAREGPLLSLWRFFGLVNSQLFLAVRSEAPAVSVTYCSHTPAVGGMESFWFEPTKKLIPKLGKTFEPGWIFHQLRSFIGSDDANWLSTFQLLHLSKKFLLNSSWPSIYEELLTWWQPFKLYNVYPI
jgi:hypothetical protein